MTYEEWLSKVKAHIKIHYTKEEYDSLDGINLTYYYKKGCSITEMGHWIIDRADF